jgi:hypothetical protein
MMNWAAFLRREAQAGGYEVLDTSNIPLEAAIGHVCALFEEPLVAGARSR